MYCKATKKEENFHSSVLCSDSGSSSSGSGSAGRSGSEKSSTADRSHHSEHHSNANSSKSDHQSDKSHDSSDDDSPSKPRSRSGHGRVKSDLWEDNPDIYGIRRSSRSRKEPDRLKIADSDSSERGDRGRSHRKSRKKRYHIYLKVFILYLYDFYMHLVLLL